jgi:hypothetical protein
MLDLSQRQAASVHPSYRKGRHYWGDWALQYMEKHGKKEQAGLLQLLHTFRDWTSDFDPALTSQAERVLDSLLSAEAVSSGS